MKLIHGRNTKLQELTVNLGSGNVLGTREALLILNALGEKCLHLNMDVHVCYVDFEKAVDKVIDEKIAQQKHQK